MLPTDSQISERSTLCKYNSPNRGSPLRFTAETSQKNCKHCTIAKSIVAQNHGAMVKKQHVAPRTNDIKTCCQDLEQTIKKKTEFLACRLSAQAILVEWTYSPKLVSRWSAQLLVAETLNLPVFSNRTPHTKSSEKKHASTDSTRYTLTPSGAVLAHGHLVVLEQSI